jgi:hypothetical protein
MPKILRRCSWCALALCAVVMLAVSGCGERGVKKLTVTGTVAYKGQKLSSGMLQFAGPEGFFSASVIQPDGKYIMTDVVPGEVKVGVMATPQSSGSSSSPDGNVAQPKTAPVVLPEKYREPDKSGVKYTITPDTTQLDINLE